MERRPTQKEYADESDAQLVPDGFSEHELAHKIYKYGNVATVFSSHEVSVASCIHGVSTSISFTTLGTDGGFPLYLGTLRTTSIPRELMPKN